MWNWLEQSISWMWKWILSWKGDFVEVDKLSTTCDEGIKCTICLDDYIKDISFNDNQYGRYNQICYN